jgi:hypothetical protein
MNSALSIWSMDSVPRVLDLCRNLSPGGRCVVMLIEPPPALPSAPPSEHSKSIAPKALVMLLRRQLAAGAYQVQQEGDDRVLIQRV